MPPLPDIWLISGVPGAGQSTVARALARRFDRAAHVEGDRLAEWVRAGAVLPGAEPAAESERQLELCIRNQCLLARSFAAAGFTPVLDYMVVTRHLLDAYRNYLTGGVIRFVTLAPPFEPAPPRDATNEGQTLSDRYSGLDALMRAELADLGLWLDNGAIDVDATVEAILRGSEAARLA